MLAAAFAYVSPSWSKFMFVRLQSQTFCLQGYYALKVDPTCAPISNPEEPAIDAHITKASTLADSQVRIFCLAQAFPNYATTLLQIVAWYSRNHMFQVQACFLVVHVILQQSQRKQAVHTNQGLFTLCTCCSIRFSKLSLSPLQLRH